MLSFLANKDEYLRSSMYRRTEAVDVGQCADGGREISRRGISLVQPPRQQRLQFAHVFETELQCLEATDCCLREHVAIQSSEREADVSLSESEFDATLFELTSECFQIVRRRDFVVVFGGWTCRRQRRCNNRRRTLVGRGSGVIAAWRRRWRRVFEQNIVAAAVACTGCRRRSAVHVSAVLTVDRVGSESR